MRPAIQCMKLVLLISFATVVAWTAGCAEVSESSTGAAVSATPDADGGGAEAGSTTGRGATPPRDSD